MTAWPVTVVSSGGMPVVNTTNGLPVENATSAVPVTIVSDYGLPVTFTNLSSTYVGTSSALATVTHTLATGWAAGDIGILFVNSASSPTLTISAGWTELTGSATGTSALGYRTKTYWRVLQGGDTGPTVSTAGCDSIVSVYRGGTTVTSGSVAIANGPLSSIGMPGFAKSGTARQIVGFVVDRDTAAVPTAPAGWTQRARAAPGFFAFSTADIEASSYVNQTYTWTTMGSSFDELGTLVEIS